MIQLRQCTTAAGMGSPSDVEDVVAPLTLDVVTAVGMEADMVEEAMAAAVMMALLPVPDRLQARREVVATQRRMHLTPRTTTSLQRPGCRFRRSRRSCGRRCGFTLALALSVTGLGREPWYALVGSTPGMSLVSKLV